MPPAEEVRSALERIVESVVFSRSERARDLLRYLVEQDLAGNGERLKGFSIAVDVFSKGARFDPSTDAVVRVQAGRLRDLIEQYYAEEGAHETLRISVPRGSYVPEYSFLDREAAGAIDAGPRETGLAMLAGTADAVRKPSSGVLTGRWPGKMSWPIAMLAGGLIALTAAFGAYRGFAPAESGVREITSVIPAMPVESHERTGSVERPRLPAVYLQLTSDDAVSDKVGSMLRRGLAGFDTIDFMARLPGADPPEPARGIDFLFLVEPGLMPGEVHLELQNIVSGKVLLSMNIAAATRLQADLEDDIADVLTTAMPVSGVVYAHILASGEQAGLTRCLILTDNFYRNQSPQSHRAAYECLAGLPEFERRSPLVLSELASLTIQAVAARYAFPADASVEQALLLARAAVQLGPNSPSAHRAMGYALARSADTRESVRWLRKAYDLNPFDLSIAASYGYGLIFAADYEAGTPVLARAVAAASAHPPWWDYALFLGHFMLSDTQAAANAVSALVPIKRAHFVAARLIVADALEREDVAAALLGELHRDYGEFASDPGAFYRRGRYPEAMTERLLDALRAAGLSADG